MFNPLSFWFPSRSFSVSFQSFSLTFGPLRSFSVLLNPLRSCSIHFLSFSIRYLGPFRSFSRSFRSFSVPFGPFRQLVGPQTVILTYFDLIPYQLVVVTIPVTTTLFLCVIVFLHVSQPQCIRIAQFPRAREGK